MLSSVNFQRTLGTYLISKWNVSGNIQKIQRFYKSTHLIKFVLSFQFHLKAPKFKAHFSLLPVVEITTLSVKFGAQTRQPELNGFEERLQIMAFGL